MFCKFNACFSSPFAIIPFGLVFSFEFIVIHFIYISLRMKNLCLLRSIMKIQHRMKLQLIVEQV